MTTLDPQQVLDAIRASRGGYHKLTLLAGTSGSGKTRLLTQIATQLDLPIINLSLHLSQRLLPLTRRQRALKAEQTAMDNIDEHLQSGLCLDNTELLFDPALRLNPLSFLQDTSRNRLLVASWNGTLFEGDLRFGAEGHPDFFSHAVAGVPVITVSRDKLQLHLAS